MLGATYLFHEFLAGESISPNSDDPRELVVRIRLYEMGDSFLGQLRRRDPQQHRALSDMKSVAPHSGVVSSRVRAYREVLDADSKRSLEKVGGRFSIYCQAEYDPIVQAVGAVEFSSVLQAAQQYIQSISLSQSTWVRAQ